MLSSSSRRATKRRRSSITELAVHGINTSRQMAKSVTHVSGTKCHLSLRPLSHDAALRGRRFPRSVSPRCYSGTVRSPRFAGAATLLRGTMIDNPDQVERLVAKLRESLPLFATVNPEVAAVIREQAPEADTLRRYYITRVDYAGDEGGIVCKVELGPENDDRLSLPRLHTCGSVTQERSLVRSLRIRSTGQTLPIRLSPTATSGSVRPCSWTFTSVAIFGSHNRCQSSSDFSLTMRPVPATWRRLAGATGSFAPIVRRRESRSASQIVLASCAAASAAVTPD